ncbi:MAG: hypothetical protein WBE77_12615, partial [Candidatus Cybelea sp.]
RIRRRAHKWALTDAAGNENTTPGTAWPSVFEIAWLGHNGAWIISGRSGSRAWRGRVALL